MGLHELQQKDTYYVAVKVFLEKDGQLFIFKDVYGHWDLPGGRIKKDEFEKPLTDIIKRKIIEELGNEVTYQLGQPVVMMRHERVESVEGDPTIRIFAVGYQATYLSGEIKISNNFTEMKWVDIKNFKPADYFAGGWLKGVEDYLEGVHHIF
ncbi:MAG: hypothetical protein PHW95_00365 [Patescibacteria group bacterium]|nr:hypothetical protein [Patescibacteria group bacterium]